jgi:cysteine desulfurase
LGTIICTPVFERIELYQDGKSPSLEQARNSLFDLVGADEKDNFQLTNSGAEAIYTAHWTFYQEFARKEGKCHFLSLPVESYSFMQSLKRLQDLDCYVRFVPLLPNGLIDLSALSEMINPKTGAVTLSLAHSLSGVIQPIEEIKEILRAKNIPLHIDVSAALGTMGSFFDFADYVTFGGDAIHGLPSTGAVFAKESLPLISYIEKRQKDDLSLITLGAAAQQTLLQRDWFGIEAARLRSLIEGIGIPSFIDVPRISNIACFSIPNVHQEIFSYFLDKKHRLNNLGDEESMNLSRYFLQCGREETTSQASHSIKITRYTTEEEVKNWIETFLEVKKLYLPLSQELF